MIEKRLEDVIKVAECVDDLWGKCVERQFQNLKDRTPGGVWAAMCHGLHASELKDEWSSIGIDVAMLDDVLERLKPAVLLSIYYYGKDYLKRLQGTEIYNAKYIREVLGNTILPPEKKPRNGREAETDDHQTIYDRTRKNAQSFVKGLSMTYDENYTNPYLVAKQVEMQTQYAKKKQFSLFLGNILQFVKKIYGADQRCNVAFGNHVIEQEISWNHFNNVLSSITIILFEAMPDLPSHKNTVFGNWTCERICDIDEIIQRYDEVVSVSLPSKVDGLDRLLIKFALEDLFHLNRINKALEVYLQYLGSHPEMDKDAQKRVAMAMSLLVYMPTEELQQLMLSDIIMLADACRDEELRSEESILGSLYRTFMINGVLFPSLVSIMARLVYCEEMEWGTPDYIAGKIEALEDTIDVGRYQTLYARSERVWNTKMLVTQRRKKNLKDKKTSEFQRLNPELNSAYSFEEIMGIMLGQANVWRIRTLLEENFSKKRVDWSEREITHRKNEKMNARTFVEGVSYAFLDDTGLLPD